MVIPADTSNEETPGTRSDGVVGARHRRPSMGKGSSSHRSKNVKDVALPQGTSPLSPQLLRDAVNAKPTTFDPKEEDKRPSTKSLLKKKSSSRRSRRTRVKLDKKNRLRSHSSGGSVGEFVSDDDGSVFSLSSHSSSVSSGTNKTTNTLSSHNRESAKKETNPASGRSPYPQAQRSDFLHDHDPEELTRELMNFPYEKEGSNHSAKPIRDTTATTVALRNRGVGLESVPLEESLVPPSGVDKNGASLAPPPRQQLPVTPSPQGGPASHEPPSDLNLDAADQYFFSERQPKSYSMAMNDWVMRQMAPKTGENGGSSYPTTNPGGGATAAAVGVGVGIVLDEEEDEDRSRHVRNMFGTIDDSRNYSVKNDYKGGSSAGTSKSSSSPRMFNSFRSTMSSAWNSLLGARDSSKDVDDERVAMNTNIAPSSEHHRRALAAVYENDVPAISNGGTSSGRFFFSNLFGGHTSSDPAMEYLRDTVDNEENQPLDGATNRTEPTTGASGSFAVFRRDDMFATSGWRVWTTNRKLALLFMGCILAAIIALVAVLFVKASEENKSPLDASWDIQYGPRSTPTRPVPDFPPEFTAENEVNGVSDEIWNMSNLMQFLSEVTSEFTLEDPNTPQGQALEWLSKDILENEESSKMSSIRVMQRYVLATLYYSTYSNKKRWYDSTNWVTGKHECTWFGIRCGNDGSFTTSNDDLGHSVTVIDLFSNNLHGTIPEEISGLSNLAQVHLYDNFISGEIPEAIAELSHLHTLYLDYNFLEGEIPVGLDDLSNLVNLDLSSNSFTGSIPSMEHLTSLVYVRLDNNDLTGQFPQSLQKLVNAEVLTMGNNGIEGSLPPALEAHQKLKIFHLHENRLEGSIPIFLSPVLEEVHLDNNKFTGSIPKIVEDASTPSLRELRLERNNLSGSIPLHLTDMYTLENLWLDDNDLTGPIPHELGRLENLESLRVLENDLTGTVPGPVCALRSYSLNTFQATCDGSNPDLSCSCCTRCTW